MGMPTDVGVIDLMLGIPEGSKKNWYGFLRAGLMDKESKEDFEFPAQYMFKEVPKDVETDDPIATVVAEMDHFGIAKAMIGVNFERGAGLEAIRRYPDRFFGSYEVNPNRGMEGVRELQRAVDELGVKSATAFPAGLTPQVPINDKRFFPLYAKCIELDIPICVCTGVPGPRVPMACQKTELVDEVCWFFPELEFVMRHGAEPWDQLAMKLMLKWPNLYYSTSAFAPKYYPESIIGYANSRGADKVMYAGYFPMGLSLERIFAELPNVPFKDDVWPKFLRENAARVFKLEHVSRFPFPIPFGWFCIGYPHEFEAGTPRALYYFATHLVGWRDGEGTLHLQDAFCPHLGAHLGHGGTVDDGCIRCPFHGWTFAADGTNVDIPYSDRTNRKARLRTYPVVEVNGLSFAWYHPDASVAPMWEMPQLPECDDDETWVPVLSTSYEVDTTWQEMAENGVDAAHFRYVHNTATVPELDSYETSFPSSAMRSSQKFQTPRGVVEGRIDTRSFGPGMSVVNFSGFADLLNVAATTPIEGDRCIIRFNFRVKSLGDEKLTRGVGQAFAHEVHKQVLEDKVIWEHKAHLVRPALADTDGPVMKFRKWAGQFYAEGVDGGDERLVFEPPWWPDRADEAPAKATASARIEG